MIYTYYVYYIPGLKIGCTTNIKKRMRYYGYPEYEILWQAEGDYEFGWIAGNKEIELQKEYGLPVDNVHFQVLRQNQLKNPQSGGESTFENKKGIYNPDYSQDEWRSKAGKVKSTWLHKLTQDQIQEIKDKYIPRKYSTYKLAEEYSVSQATIMNIIQNKIYN